MIGPVRRFLMVPWSCRWNGWVRGTTAEVEYQLSWRRTRWAEWAWRTVAFALPRKLCGWVVVRVWSHGTTGPWGNTHPDRLSYGEAMRRWEDE